MRITTARIISQSVFAALFLAFITLTSLSMLSDYPALRFWLSKFLEIDPLVAVSTAMTTHTLYKGLLWSLVVLLPTLFLGRFFCNWVCPFGTLHHLTGWLFHRRGLQAKIDANQYRRSAVLKYYILVGMLVAALFGTLQIGLLDPLVFVHRAFTVNVLPLLGRPVPALELPGGAVLGGGRLHQFGWILGFAFFVLLTLNLVRPRWFCRVLCPLGALLGVLSRFSLWRIERDPRRCVNCNVCVQGCEGACEPDARLRRSECFVCFNCIEDCPHGALRFAFLPSRASEVTGPDAGRRGVVLAALSGLFFCSWTRAAGKTTRDFSSRVIRPPGAVEELEFLERCLKCDQCLRVCPTNVLQPALFETGLEGLWTPVMNFRIGFCQLHCTACGYVCPTGAIQHLTVDEKLGLGPAAEQGPVRLGTAHFDLGRCLPWSKNTPCMVCEEICPVSPKAIYSEYQQFLLRDGRKSVTAATANSVTLAETATGVDSTGAPCRFVAHQFRGDETASYHVRTTPGPAGTGQSVRIADNNVDTLALAAALEEVPPPGTEVGIYIEYKVPKMDTSRCIG